MRFTHICASYMATPGPKKRIVLLGATGSIGESTLRVIAAHRDRLELVGIAAQRNGGRLAEIARQFGVRHVGLHDPVALTAARQDTSFPAGTQFHGGIDGLCQLASLPEADIVLIAVVGTAGLQPALAAIAARKTIALASKEILVMAGKFVMAALRATCGEPGRTSGSRLLPVDSEHNAVFQCLEGHRGADVAGSCSPPRAARFATGRWRSSRRSRRPTRSSTPTGRWARRSRSTPPPSPTRASS